jgi:two-component system, NtrC family, sensor kinase
LEYCPAKDLPLANFDPEAMHRAILNIVTNAIDAAAQRMREVNDPEEDEQDDDSQNTGAEATLRADALDLPQIPLVGKVVVETQYDPLGGWTILVTDNGSGIDAHDREKIFSLFESSKGARGTGLGLPVSEKILREHGGRIEIRDAAVPPGACFALHLPPSGTDVSAGTGDETMS